MNENHEAARKAREAHDLRVYGAPLPVALSDALAFWTGYLEEEAPPYYTEVTRDHHGRVTFVRVSGDGASIVLTIDINRGQCIGWEAYLPSGHDTATPTIEAVNAFLRGAR